MDPIADWMLRLGWILPAWLFALGGIVGSFLNVVVYRLPAGRSIVHPGSQCPACGHPIRWYHNLPILSWLLLGGLSGLMINVYSPNALLMVGAT